MKKDILAIITFVTTGLLFYLIQVEGPVGQSLTSHDGDGIAEEILQDGCDAKAPSGLVIKEGRTRDS